MDFKALSRVLDFIIVVLHKYFHSIIKFFLAAHFSALLGKLLVKFLWSELYLFFRRLFNLTYRFFLWNFLRVLFFVMFFGFLFYLFVDLVLVGSTTTLLILLLWGFLLNWLRWWVIGFDKFILFLFIFYWLQSLLFLLGFFLVCLIIKRLVDINELLSTLLLFFLS